jgi:predicted transcriptional regulator of viral defense system
VTLLEAHARLVAMDQPVFHTSDAGARLGMANAHASTVLARLAVFGHVARLRRGVWAFPGRVDRLALPGHLTSPFPAYVSLQSALYFHGMIAQVPAVTYAVSLARTRRFRTPVGAVSIHHLAPAFFFGFTEVGRQGAQMATPEKALVDFLYFGPARSKMFRALPELELPPGFSFRTARRMAGRITSRARRTSVLQRLNRLAALARTPVAVRDDRTVVVTRSNLV